MAGARIFFFVAASVLLTSLWVPGSQAQVAGKVELLSILEGNIGFLQGVLTTTLPNLQSRLQHSHPACTAAITQVQAVTTALTTLMTAKTAASGRAQLIAGDSPEKTDADVLNPAKLKLHDPHYYGYGPYVKSGYPGTYPAAGNAISVLARINLTEQRFVDRLTALLASVPAPVADVVKEATAIRNQIQTAMATLSQSILVLRGLPSYCNINGYSYGYARPYRYY